MKLKQQIPRYLNKNRKIDELVINMTGADRGLYQYLYHPRGRTRPDNTRVTTVKLADNETLQLPIRTSNV